MGEEPLIEALKEKGANVLPVVGGKQSVMILTSDDHEQERIENLAHQMGFTTEPIRSGGLEHIMAQAI